MKNNKELLDIHLGGNMNVGTLTPSAIYDIMEVAQMEFIKQFFKNFHSYPNISASYTFKHEVASMKTILEFKEGEEYNWMAFMIKRREDDEEADNV